jgi:hypothetical protein
MSSVVSNLTIKQILDRMVAANEAYRNPKPSTDPNSLNVAVMSDAEYDALEERLAELVDGADDTFVEVREAKAFLATIGAPVGRRFVTRARWAR